MLFAISIVLFIFVLWNTFTRIDIVPSKQDHSVAWRKAEIDKNQNIDSVKELAKASFDANRQSFKDDSKLALQSIWMLLVLLIIQLYLLFTNPKFTPKP